MLYPTYCDFFFLFFFLVGTSFVEIFSKAEQKHKFKMIKITIIIHLKSGMSSRKIFCNILYHLSSLCCSVLSIFWCKEYLFCSLTLIQSYNPDRFFHPTIPSFQLCYIQIIVLGKRKHILYTEPQIRLINDLTVHIT